MDQDLDKFSQAGSSQPGQTGQHGQANQPQSNNLPQDQPVPAESAPESEAEPAVPERSSWQQEALAALDADQGPSPSPTVGQTPSPTPAAAQPAATPAGAEVYSRSSDASQEPTSIQPEGDAAAPGSPTSPASHIAAEQPAYEPSTPTSQPGRFHAPEEIPPTYQNETADPYSQGYTPGQGQPPRFERPAAPAGSDFAATLQAAAGGAAAVLGSLRARLAKKSEHQQTPYHDPAHYQQPLEEIHPMAVVGVVSPRGVEYAMMTLTLWLGAGSLLGVLLSLINAGKSYSVLTFPISVLIVCLPVFYWFFMRLKQAELNQPELKLDPSKRRFTQFTQVVAFAACLFTLIAFVYFLISKISGQGGTSVLKAILDVVAVLIVAGGILAYYWIDEHRGR